MNLDEDIEKLKTNPLTIPMFVMMIFILLSCVIGTSSAATVTAIIVGVFVVKYQIKRTQYLKEKSEAFIGFMSIHFGEVKAKMALSSDSDQIDLFCRLNNPLNKIQLSTDNVIYLNKYIDGIFLHRKNIGAIEISKEALFRLLMCDDGKISDLIKKENEKCVNHMLEKSLRENLIPNDTHYVSKLYRETSPGDFESFNKLFNVYSKHRLAVLNDYVSRRTDFPSSPIEMKNKYKLIPNDMLESIITEYFPNWNK